MLLKGKVIVVTGAGKGIGRACVEFFVSQGANVVGLSRSQDDIRNLEKEFMLKSCAFISGNVTSRADLESAAKRALSNFGRIDGVVNNAGMRQRKDFLEIEQADWEDVIQNNLTSCYLSMQTFLPYMVNQRSGSIVNVASVVGERGLPQLAGYAASKAGMIGLTKAVATEFAANNIRVNAVCPGFAETSYAESFKASRPELYQFTIERTPMRRWGTSEEVAHAIAYLLSDLSTYVTGSVFAVDGGWMAT